MNRLGAPRLAMKPRGHSKYTLFPVSGSPKLKVFLAPEDLIRQDRVIDPTRILACPKVFLFCGSIFLSRSMGSPFLGLHNMMPNLDRYNNSCSAFELPCHGFAYWAEELAHSLRSRTLYQYVTYGIRIGIKEFLENTGLCRDCQRGDMVLQPS